MALKYTVPAGYAGMYAVPAEYAKAAALMVNIYHCSFVDEYQIQAFKDRHLRRVIPSAEVLGEALRENGMSSSILFILFINVKVDCI